MQKNIRKMVTVMAYSMRFIGKMRKKLREMRMESATKKIKTVMLLKGKAFLKAREKIHVKRVLSFLADT